MSLRIAMVDASGGGGARRAALAMARGLARRGHDVDVWSLFAAGGEDVSPARARASAAAYVPIIDLGQLSVSASPLGGIEARRLGRAHRALGRELDAGRYDIVFTHACRYVEHLRVSAEVRAPIVVYVHALPRFRGSAPPHGGVARRLALRVLRGRYAALAAESERELRAARLVVANSKLTARTLHDLYGVSSRLIYPGVDTDSFRPLGLERERFVLYPALLSRQKRQELLIDALGLIDEARRPSLVLLYTASSMGFARRLVTRARDRRVDLVLRAHPSEAEIVAAYNKAAIVAVPAEREALGLVALEAMACGAPVVAAAEGGMLETVEDGLTGRLVGAEPASFARAIEELLADPQERERMGARGRARAVERWAWPRCIEALESALADAVAGRGAS